MYGFAGGLLVGLLAGGVLAALAAVLQYRRSLCLQQRAKQAERLAELGTLAGGLAHEIKNPLSTVQVNLQLMQEDIPADHPSSSRLLSRLTTTQRETARLRDILDDFLRYAGRLELDRRPVDLNRMLEEMADFFHPQASQQRVQLRVRKPEEPAVVNGDEKLLKQALLNLMLNGTQAMPTGGELILSVRRNGREARLDVVDTGSGIAPEALSRIFDAYYSTRKGGTGLGLAMTRRIIEEHGGRLTVQSEVGKGSDFAIHLPLLAAPQGNQPPAGR